MSAPQWLELLGLEQLEGYRRNPHLQCEVASVELVETLAAGQVLARVVEFARPDGTTHCVALCDGVVVDLTFGQYDAGAPWPLVEPVEAYATRHASGPVEVDILQRWYEAGWEVDEMRDHWQGLGLLPS